MPISADVQQLIISSAGSAPGALTQTLRANGYTNGQISQLFAAAATSTVFPAQTIAWLQQENAYLADQTAANNRMWALLFAAGFGFYLYMNRRR